MAQGDETLGSCTLKLSISASLTLELDLSTPDDTLSQTPQVKLAGGTGTEAGNQLWHDQRSVAYGATDSLDLYGTLVNAFGTTVNFCTVRAVVIINRSTADYLTLGGGANAWGGLPNAVPLRPAGATYPAVLYLCAPNADGMAVTAGTADILRVAHGGTSSAAATYDVIIIGEQA